MRDHKPVAIAVTVGTLAIAANGAGAIIAMSATARPEAMGFGIAGLSAAFIGLVLTTLWARRDEAPPRPRPIFAPQAAPEDDEIPGAALSMAAAEPLAAPPTEPEGDRVVIYISDWLAAKG